MKKLSSVFLFGVIFSLLFFYGAKISAQENRGAFTIADFEIAIDAQRDSSLVVSERITVDFSQPRHGIFRNIPVKYRDDKGFIHNFRFKTLSVSDQRGNPWKYEQSKESGDVILKIGESDSTVNGRQIYVINYQIQRGIRHFDDHAEIYWNPVGTGWPTTIDHALIDVRIPNDVIFAEEDLVCFSGARGSRTQNCAQRVVSADHLQFETAGKLQPFEGLTVAIKFPPDAISQPQLWQKILWFVADNWGLALPVAVFCAMFWLWAGRGKELNLRKTTIVQFDPPENLTPGEMAYLLKERYASEHVTADIVNLAVKGFLKINEIKDNSALAPVKSMFKAAKRYELESTKSWENDLSLTGHERKIMLGLFGDEVGKKVEISKLKKFHESVVGARSDLEKRIRELEYFEQHPLNYKSVYAAGGIIGAITLVVAGSSAQRVDVAIGGIISGVIMVAFGLVMSKKTRNGAEAYRHAQGFRQYIYTAERYRVKFQEDEKIFEKVLPYAMAFGLADKWAKAFEGIYKQDPQWYSSSRAGAFHPALFAASLNDNFGSVTQSVSSPPSSSSSSGFGGGGFSGGGGGGGGGGSW